MSMFKLSPEAKKYWAEFRIKCLDNLASVKVWFFMFPFIVSTVILTYLVLDFAGVMKTSVDAISNPVVSASISKNMQIIANMFIAWCTFNVSLAGTVIVVRETFKIKKMTSLNIEKRENTEIIERIRP